MNLFEKAFLEIKKLVKDFKASEDYYLSPKYQEKEVRDDFINKFFIALGWDVIHDHQKNPYEQEVKVEKGVLVRGAQKRADYSFSLAPNFREPKFLVEAKKPARNLKNADDYFQTIRYGWHKQTPLGILTDFEEFHILDCRYGADINNALKKCYKEYRYTDYANEEKFAEIYWLFSREAVANNSIEKIAETLPKHKGKVAGKTLLTYEISQTIDDAFLLEIDLMREKLAKALKKNDEALTSEELTEATQKIIDRLVFIRFLEDKLIETEHYVSGFGDKGNAWEDFIKLCRRLDVKYNGVVFKKHFIDEQKFNGAEANEFLMICKGICHLNSRFLFNEIPIHIIGSIYERFLGKEVHATDKRVQIEEKPEVRKAGGVYYTPKYIVDYIVNNTIGKLIDNKTPEQISQMRFADIACGSGSFLIGACECLLQYHIKYYNEKFKNKTAIDGRSEDFGLCEYRDGQWNLTLKQKQNILLNNIYGVDIDAQAVEVTQLSLFLKLLEDETLGSTQNRQDVMFSKVLPDLSKNIICGNSLIGTDIKVSAEEERKINPMDFKYAFPEVFKSKTEKGYIFIPDIGIDEERDNDI
ncbi:MAG: DNA methyltransferase, partial [Bacteroidales bacterium]